MIDKMTDEAIRNVINNAPKGAEYWTSGYDIQYRKLVLDCVFGWFSDDKKWARAIDNDVAMERIDKGFWIPNLSKELAIREGKSIKALDEFISLAHQDAMSHMQKIECDDGCGGFIPEGALNELTSRFKRALQDSNYMNEFLSKNKNPEEKKALDAIEQVEWKSGDAVAYGGDTDCHTFIGYTWDGMACVRYDTLNNFFEIAVSEISKPETPEAKKEREEREELEATYDLYCYSQEELLLSAQCISMEEFCWEGNKYEREWFLAIVRKTGYRKGE